MNYYDAMLQSEQLEEVFDEVIQTVTDQAKRLDEIADQSADRNFSRRCWVVAEDLRQAIQ